MTDFKNLIIHWGKATLKAVLGGVVIFALFALFTKISSSILLGFFTAYLIMCITISNRSESFLFVYSFCKKNKTLAFIMLFGSLVVIIFFSSISALTWPLLISGLATLAFSAMGIRGARMSRYYK